MIKRIELVNFMSHEHTVIEPHAGLTVLVGPNNCGKSAVVTALQILAYNEPSTYVLRHDEKECRIRLETDDGQTVEWSRGKNKPATYRINGQLFDRLRGSVPDELVDVLRLSKVNRDASAIDVHFAPQKSPIFLLNDQPRVAAEFFAASSDAAHLMEMQNLHQQKVRDAKREKVQLTDDLHQLRREVDALEPVDAILDQLVQCETAHTELVANEKRCRALADAIAGISRASFEISWLEAGSEYLAQIDTPPVLVDTGSLETLVRDLRLADVQLARQTAQGALWDALTSPPVLFDDRPLAQCAERIAELNRQLAWFEASWGITGRLRPVPQLRHPDGLNDLTVAIAQLEKDLEQTDRQWRELHKEETATRADIERWIRDNPTCPTCGAATTADHIIGAVQPAGPPADRGSEPPRAHQRGGGEHA